MVYSATCSKNESEYISQHYKDQNTVTQSLPYITDVEQEEKDTETSRY
jgi:ferritin